MKKTRRALGVIGLVALAFQPAPAVGEIKGLGRLEFANSGAAEAQEAFIRGVLLLHSFEYADAREAFRQAQAIDPSFALAWWGEAMCHNFPLWRSQDLEGARDVLVRFAPTREARLAKAQTEREKGYLQAVEILFGDGDKVRRDAAYSEAMRRLYERYPEDLEAASFYALSILGTRGGERDFATYMRAGAIVEEVFDANPRHPGAAHYLIHSYDDPVHAPLGLRAARVYAAIAPGAAHAQHMISHIYIALGRWRESALADERSFAVSEAKARRAGTPRGNHHALMWLAYSLLQQGRWSEARAKLAIMDEDTAAQPTASNRWHQIYMRSAYQVETEDWEVGWTDVDASDLSLSAVAAQLYVRGVGALAGDDLLMAQQALADLDQALVREPPAGSDFYTTTAAADRLAARTAAQELAGLIALTEGRVDEALVRLHKAVEIEESMELAFGPPLVVKPAHELLGEVLLELERPVEAIERFEQALARAPRRTAALRGLSQAGERGRDPEAARRPAEALASIQATSAEAPSQAEEPGAAPFGEPLWGKLEPGPYAVGFKVAHVVDASRPVRTKVDGAEPPKSRERGRPLQIAWWYPAMHSAGDTGMRYTEYVQLELAEAAAAVRLQEVGGDLIERFTAYPYLSAEVADADLQRLLSTPTPTVRDAVAKSGAFPLILLAQGNSDPVYRHSILAEVLASHGYIVATTPGISRSARSSNDSPIVEQTADLRFALNYLQDLPGLDRRRLALIASSYGGGAVGQLMLQNTDVDAVISLDSFLSIAFGLEEAQFEASPNYATGTERSIPILNLYQEQEGVVRHDLRFLEAFEHSERYHLRLNELQHFNLTSLGRFAGLLPDLSARPELLVGGAPAALGHDVMCRYVLHFLRATLDGDETSRQFLRQAPEAHGVPAKFVTLRRSQAEP
ncbi:MAG: hypothetical protein AAF657_13570 [Acidobacteriota bacterium]